MQVDAFGLLDGHGWLLKEFGVLKLSVHDSKNVHVGFLGLVELFDQVNELDLFGGVLAHVSIDTFWLVAAKSGIRDLELRLIDSWIGYSINLFGDLMVFIHGLCCPKKGRDNENVSHYIII